MAGRRLLSAALRVLLPGVVLRRIVFLGVGMALLAAAGLSWLTLHWRGENGRPPAGRLYLLGDFPGRSPILRLRRTEPAPDVRADVCYAVEPQVGPERAAAQVVCSGERRRVWLGDARVEVEVAAGESGAPALSLAGARVRRDEWIGSSAEGGSPDEPRFPLRSYGTPSRAARRVGCPARLQPRRGAPVACVLVNDRLRRLALARRSAPASGDPRLAHGDTVDLRTGDELWLGLVAYGVRVEASGRDTVLVLERREGPVTDAPAESLVGRGGDRRWLGRLWPRETPDPAAPLTEDYAVYPMRVRYSPEHLSTRRTNYQMEDVLQRLVDGEWLCLAEKEGQPRVDWRSLDVPGCDPGAEDRTAAHTTAERDDYRLGRYGSAGLGERLVAAADAGLLRQGHLEDPSTLPFAFDWALRAGGGGASPQPAPVALWGVRFGAVQMGRAAGGGADLPPTVVLRRSTARSLVELREAGRRVATFYLPLPDSGARTPRAGTLCLGSDVLPGGRLLREADGTHQPLGTVALRVRPWSARWAPAPAAGCAPAACRLRLRTTSERADTLHVALSGPCGPGQPGGGVAMAEGDSAHLDGGLVLRYLRRTDPAWVAASDPATGERRIAQEFAWRAGLAPLLGEAGSHGVEAAVREWSDTSRAPLELTIDGDVQLQAAEIVRATIAAAPAPANSPSGTVTAVVLDARTGQVLAAVTESRPPRSAAGGRPTAWDAATGRTGAANRAFMRADAFGSTMKIVGGYLLANGGLTGSGHAPPGALQREAALKEGGYGIILAARRRGEAPEPRRCSTGPHDIPRDERGFTDSVFVAGFAESCNAFFVMTGLRHASAPAARVQGDAGAAPPAGTLAVGSPLFSLHQPAEPLAGRIRAGIVADAALPPTTAPRSLYGALLRLGFQPEPTLAWTRHEKVLEVEEGGRKARVDLAGDWFAPPSGAAPALRPGTDFVYPTIPSPGRLDESDGGHRPVESYGDTAFAVLRDEQVEGARADAQLAMLLIGQSSVTSSALGLTTLFAPAARADGRAVAPCLFRAGCRDPRAAPVVLDSRSRGAEVLNAALLRVVSGGTATGKLNAIGFGRDGAWGGKTGTFNRDVHVWPEARLGPEADWEALTAYACGVLDAPRPAPGVMGNAGTAAALASRLAAAPPGSASASRVCDQDRPLHPAGIHRYRPGPESAALDSLSLEVGRIRRSATVRATFHAMVLVALPPRGGLPRSRSAAEGIVVAVLEDDDMDVAVPVAGRLAAAVERWATVRR